MHELRDLAREKLLRVGSREVREGDLRVRGEELRVAAPVDDRGWRTAPLADPWGEAPPPAPAPIRSEHAFFDQEADD